MKELKMKAMKGVTLVELLVVILIVIILSVSMLPLLQPYVIKAQYAAEPVPVIGNLRTKIGLYQYDKGKLPTFADTATDGSVDTPVVETWAPAATEGGQTEASADAVDYYTPAYAEFTEDATTYTKTLIDPTDTAATADIAKHIQTRIDVDYQDLKGKRSKPHHYQYLVMRNGSQYAYFVGCFGDGSGLKMGTGYAVCEILMAGHKYVGTWERYKPEPDADGNDQVVVFTGSTDVAREGSTKTIGCWVQIGRAHV